MLKSVIDIIRKKNLIYKKGIFDTPELKNIIDLKKPYAVVRDDGKIVHQFNDSYDASVFSVKLNISYTDNDIKSFSKVIKLSV